MPRCSGYGIRSRQQAVGGDRVRHVRRLDRDLEVRRSRGAPSARRTRPRRSTSASTRVLALERVQVLGQRAGVDADAHRRRRLASPASATSATFSGPADVARVQADAVRAGVDRLQRQRVVEVDVGDDRDRRLAHDRLERLDVLVARHGARARCRRPRRRRADLRPSWRRGSPSRSSSSSARRRARRRRSGRRRRGSCRCGGHLPSVYEAALRPAYSASISPAYFSAIGLRLSFIVGVSSSPPGSQSPSTSAKRLICSTRASFALAASTPSCTAARTRGSFASVARSRASIPCALGPRRREVGVEHEQRDVVRPPVADRARLADQRRGALQRRLDVRRRHVLAGGADDQLLLAVDDRT